jgi:guanylate kinase
MTQMYKIVALMGEAGSGKDRTLKEVLKAAPHFNEIVSCTTRPPR